MNGQKYEGDERGKKWDQALDGAGRKESKEAEISKADMEKVQYVMKQLQGILAADQKEKEMQAKKTLQEMEMFKSRLKDTMKSTLKTTKGKLIKQNERNMKASSRLAFLQNKQLVTELEYQSKQAEKLIARNVKLEEQMAEMKREIEIHKQVEAELARQSQIYQKQVRNFNIKLKTYQNTSQAIPLEQKQEKGKSGDELINFLEEKLDETEKKYSAFQIEYEELQGNYRKQQKIIERMKDKYSRAAFLLVEFMDNVMNDTPGLLQDEKNFYLDVERL